MQQMERSLGDNDMMEAWLFLGAYNNRRIEPYSTQPVAADSNALEKRSGASALQTIIAGVALMLRSYHER